MKTTKTTTKTCTKCGETKPASHFYPKSSQYQKGRQAQCKQCTRTRALNRYYKLKALRAPWKPNRESLVSYLTRRHQARKIHGNKELAIKDGEAIHGNGYVDPHPQVH